MYGTSYPPTATVYRVKVNVQRFESWPGSQAVIDAVWSVHAAGANAVLTCRTVATERVGAGYDALVTGHRQVVDEIAAAISASVRSLNALPPSSSSRAKTVTVAPLPARHRAQ
ncbi:lipoprotein [Candidatus Burkholderia pumila]|uniref:Lipoprotein n=1 Tax=Candidatus Burkholderia pumila TaxID=1090375 RepID=A0ABR5HNQ4_9BURK|nr:lipoprotein [Candidatus Burkholderia pumila]